MDNAQKAIMIGVGLFITIIVIAAVMLITGIGQDLLNSGTKKASSISDNLQAQLTSQYDGTTLTGSQVVAAVKSNYKTDGLAVVVKTTKNKEAKQYGKVSAIVTAPTSATTFLETDGTSENNAPASIGPLSDSTSSDYVNPSVSYKAYLIKIEDSEAVVGIYFEQK